MVVKNARNDAELPRARGPVRARVMPRALTACVIFAALAACDGGPGGGPDGGPGDGFDDATALSLDSVEDFEAMAEQGHSSSALKFVITRFQHDDQELRFLDSAHYALHDEWYWFRLMNGARVDGVDVDPVDVGRRFATVAEIVDWARARPAELLPLDLTFVGDGRLYSPHFYELALFSSPKTLGIGTVLHFPARPDVGLVEQWGLELEYQHVLDVAELETFFHVLEETLPPDVGPRVKLLLRSPQHEELAQQLIDEGSPLASRILRYDEVTVPGETEVYSEGLVAGRLKLVPRGGSFDDARSSDVLVTEDVPDFLPQCAGLVTGVPQTALAHVNILAKNRGIPNAYRGGVVDDPNLDQLARVNAPVIVKASAPDQLRIVPMTNEDFATFRTLTVVPPSAVPAVDLTNVELTYDVGALSFADEATWRPILGGKAAGFIALLDAGDVTCPDSPLAISIKPYVEHLAPFRERLQAMLNDSTFQSNPDVRLLVLEGRSGWNARRPLDPSFPDRFLASRTDDDVLRLLVQDGGVQGLVRETPIAPATLAAITAALEESFGGYADEQGLRFRSSSNVEDAEGFNGAGLYTSNTGYLHADRLTGSKHDKTVENAIRETWASYWGSEAFEERRLANVAHLTGSMAIIVHANFQDDLEIGNGVFTYTILPPGHPDGAAVLEMNAQEGALSVTNPPPGDPNLPEVDRIVLDEQGTIHIERVRGSTVLPEGRFVLNDTQLTHVFDQARRVAELWFAVDNAALPLSQQRSTLTLDFELREVAAGWPVLANGNVVNSRVVIKQVRTLEPSFVRVPATVQAQPIPRDVLARALLVEQRTCEAASFKVTVNEVYTDPRKKPDLGFSLAPFTSFVVVDFTADVPELGATAGQRRSAIHTAYDADHPGMDTAGGPGSPSWALELVVDPAKVDQVGFSHVAFDDGTLTVGDDVEVSSTASCEVTTLFASPEAFLESILARTPDR
jgi:hypothetical protein